MIPAPMMRPTQAPASPASGKPIRMARAFRLLQDPHRDLGDDAEQPLGADEDPEQVIAAGIEMLAAQPDHIAIHQHDLAAEHVVRGQSVFEAVHPAGILRHIAADGAGDLRGGIGRIIEAAMCHCLGDGEIGHAWLNDRDPVGEIDLADAVEPRHPEQYAVAQRQRPAGQRGAGPAGDHLDPVGMAVAEHARNLVDGSRQHHRQGKLAIGSQAVGFVGPHLALGGNDPLVRDDSPQRPHDFAAALEHGFVADGHLHRHGESP